jgi:ABC-2 type transport system permease protein
MSRLVRAEVLKLLSTRLWWGLLIGVVLTSVGLALLTALVAGTNADGDATGAPLLADPGTLRSTYTAGLNLAYLFALSLGVMAMAGEYRHQTMSATVLAVPRRWKVVVAKVLALVVIGAGYGVVTVAASFVAGAPVLAARGADVWRSDANIPRALLLAVLAVALWTLIGLGVGTLIKNQVVALLVAIGVAWIVEPILGFALNQFDLGEIARFLPTSATSAVADPALATGDASVTLLSWWAGALVLLGYAAVSAGLGTAFTLRRDIT